MRSRNVEIDNKLFDHTVQVTLVQNDDVIQTFAAYTPSKAFTRSINGAILAVDSS